MWAGYDTYLSPDARTVRSLVKFNLSAIPSGTAINGAYLHLYHIDSWDIPSRTERITTYRITSNWSACSTTWSNQPSIGSAYGSQDLPWDAGQWYAFDVTDLVRGWISGSIPNFGVELRGPEAMGADAGWRSFATLNSTADPYLTIDYAVATGSATSLPADLPRAADVSAPSSADASRTMAHVDALNRGQAEPEKCSVGVGSAQKCRASQ
jgi:hypothetical protein